MTTDLQNRDWGSGSSVKLNDCWNKIGIWGHRECGELKKVIHCRNCIVYSSAAAQLLEAELPPDYLQRWTAHFATESKVQSRQIEAALIFRIGAEWLAMSPPNLQEIAEGRPIRSVPKGRSATRCGLANIRGELVVCVALDQLLGLEKTGPENSNSKRAIYRRLIVAGRQGARFVFPVDEVHGIHRFDANELKGVPSTAAKAQAAYMRGILLWQNKSVGCLDDQPLFDMLDRNLT